MEGLLTAKILIIFFCGAEIERNLASCHGKFQKIFPVMPKGKIFVFMSSQKNNNF